jgi:photosystem II stability/assembly factor-like uncharacterized protein
MLILKPYTNQPMQMRKTVLLAGLILGFITNSVFAQVSSSTYSGLNLRHIGPANMSGRVVDLAVKESDPFTFYAATATGGVWETTNNGVTWKPIFENEATHSVGAITLNQKYTNILWVGTGERASRQSSGWGDGVYKSSNGGKTWENMGLKDSHHIGRIALHPTDSNTVYVAAMGHLWGPNNERGLYKTTDGGKTWERIIYVNDDTGVVDVTLDPSNPNTVYAATYQRRRKPYGFDGGGPGSGLHKSTDGGKTWKELKNGLPAGEYGRIGITIYPKNPNIMYASVEQGFQYNASTAYNERRAGLYRSEDKGESWTLMSDWNPRPMYASQPLVDPNNDKRVYMQNQFSVSEDSGKTFRAPRQSLHGDDRILWVNPNDSRHVIKGDDGGVGISYDMAKTWLFVTNLPVSQFYRISVDMAIPYNVYGGLQDNGSWVGPNATYNGDGILNSDWRRTGGGDGFLSLPHRAEAGVMYGESQYLGLFKLDLNTGQRKSIRPGDPKGAIGARRNWDFWGPGLPEPDLENAMAPANWDGPFFLSHHNSNTIYAGTNVLWKSTDGGNSWKSLGDLTTKVNRRELKIMDKRADENTASLDDGIPYYPTLTAVAEDKFIQGHLYAGTDDGLLQVSEDDGQTWTNVTSRLSGLPKETWINTIEVSSHNPGTAFVAINNYRNDDFTNYLYKTSDGGKSWTSILGNLPANRVVRTMREDPKNSSLLYLATEFGFYISNNEGKNWVELKNNMPTLPFNDMVIHPRDNDLVLATHGRGVWILDNLNAIQELTPSVSSQNAALFSIPTAERIDYTREGAHVGDMFFRGDNPTPGAIIDYYLKSATDKKDIALTIHDTDGNLIRTLAPDTTAGIQREYWDMNHADLNAIPSSRGRGFGMGGAPVVPGNYVAKLVVKGEAFTQTFEVKDDPRLDIDIVDRKAWTAKLMEIGNLYNDVIAEMANMQPLQAHMATLKRKKVEYDESAGDEIEDTIGLYSELLSRTRGLYSEAQGWIGLLTQDQASQLAYYKEMLVKLRPKQTKMLNETVKKLNKGLSKENQFKSK